MSRLVGWLRSGALWALQGSVALLERLAKRVDSLGRQPHGDQANFDVLSSIEGEHSGPVMLSPDTTMDGFLCVSFALYSLLAAEGSMAPHVGDTVISTKQQHYRVRFSYKLQLTVLPDQGWAMDLSTEEALLYSRSVLARGRDATTMEE